MHRILIIEDDPVIRTQMTQMLRFERFEALEAVNGRQGVASALRALPDLIICDIMMPELDGFGVLRALRDNPQTATIPFIFLTALVAGDKRHLGMEEGADDYITKPFAPNELLGSVRRRLEKRKRQLEEGCRRTEEVSLAVAASVPQEILEALDHITAATGLVTLISPDDDRPVAEMHRTVRQESNRLRRMMRRLHLYAQLPQLYANRFELAGTGLFAMTAEPLERVAREAGRNWNRETDLVIALEPALLPLREEYLAQLVEELVDNACKFSAPGTPVEVTGCGPRTFWTLSVTNRGTGMSDDQIARIGAFKQFWAGDRKPRGLGLGLVLAQGIARLHGCEFTLRSDADTTTASVLAPLETQAS